MNIKNVFLLIICFSFILFSCIKDKESSATQKQLKIIHNNILKYNYYLALDNYKTYLLKVYELHNSFFKYLKTLKNIKSLNSLIKYEKKSYHNKIMELRFILNNWENYKSFLSFLYDVSNIEDELNDYIDQIMEIIEDNCKSEFSESEFLNFENEWDKCYSLRGNVGDFKTTFSINLALFYLDCKNGKKIQNYFYYKEDFIKQNMTNY